VEEFATTTRWDAKKFASQVDGYQLVVCVGGDGTLNEIINGVPPKGDIPVAIVPTGTGNVFAKQIGIGSSRRKAFRSLARFRTHLFDMGEANGRRFVSMLGAGFDACMVDAFHEYRKGRSWTLMLEYLLVSTRVLRNFQPPKILIEIDGRIVERNASFVQVANASSYGGPFKFSPRAVPDDGLLEVSWFCGRFRRDVPRLFWAGIRRNLLSVAGTMSRRGRKVCLSSDIPIAYHLDGDPAGELPATITILPHSVSFVVFRYPHR
jgi:diacylglycerol kinase (ATP)